MVSYKGKEVARDDSLGKRKRGGGGNAGRGRKRKNRGVIQFVEDAAYEIDEDEASDESDFGDDFLVEEFKTQVKVKTEPGKDHHLPFVPKEEELSEEELEKMLEERYKPGSSFVKYAEDTFESKRSMEGDVVMPSPKDPTIWKVKCTVGRERQSVFCLMQKFVDLHTLGTKLQMISAFTFEHVKGYIYIEAERQFDVNEACKGLCTIYSSRVSPVPMNEVSHLLSVRSKYNEPSMGKWARIKNGKYKGDLAQVIAVNDARKKATVKLIPRIDLQAMAEKYGGGIAPKRTATPAPRLIRSTELDEFRPLIQYRRDRDAGLVFEVLDGHQLKDGYLYKKVSIDSLSFWGVVPSEEELLKFEPSKKEESDCQEWLTQLYGEPKKKRVIKSDKGGGKGEGSSSSSVATGFELHDLVFFGRTNFGVIVGTEKDEYFKILKEGSEGPVVVTVDVHQLKHASFDKKFSALDHRTKTISINDTVRVLEGPLEGRQGIVKQIFRGIVFLCDENEQENSGYFCCKSQICEKIKFSDDACKGKGGESGAAGFEDFSSSPKSPLSPKKAWQGRESGSNFNREDKDGMFSIGQSLRIRVGPLKGYLCRVLALRRSDVTVKLDSQQKILTVKSEHLAEVRGKSSAVSLGDDAESVKPFDLLGTEDSSRDWMSGAATSAEGDRWGSGGLSTERSSWPAFPSSGFSLQPESNFTNPSVDNDTNKDAGDAAWEIKATPNQNSSWGAVPDAKGEDTWNKTTANAGSGSIASDSWGRAKKTSEDQANDASSVWGKKNDGSSVAAPSWGKKNDASSAGGWGNAEPKNHTGGWGNAGGNSSQSEAEASGWTKATTVAGGQTESWGAVKKDSASGWGKSKDSQERSAAGTEEGSWGKAAEKWGSKDDSSGSKAAWNGSTSASESQTGGWGNAGESSGKKPDGGSSWGNQAGGSSWTKQNDVNTGDESKGWGKPSGGDQGFGGWNKDGMGNDDDTKSFDGGRGSGGRRGGRGGSQGGRNACYKCGETGHMARECSQGGGGGGRYGGSGGGGNACFKCGETGHMARDCSQGGGGGGNACFKCGETGHMARDCSKGGGNTCFKCGETGHMARDCSQGGGSSGGGNACFKCGETGHMARDCSQGGGNACFKCGETGHMARDCSQGGGGGSKAAWGGSAAESKTSTGGWGSGGWSSSQLETKTSGWKATSVNGDKTESWGAVRKDGATGWGKSMDPQESSGSKAPWGGLVAEPKDKTEGWGSAGGSSGSKAPWGGSMAKPKDQTGGWGTAGGSSGSQAPGGGSMAEPKDQTGGWGNSGGSSGSKASWGGSMVEPKDQTGGWGSAGGSSGSKAPWGGSMAEPKDVEPKDQSGGWGRGAGASAAQSKVEASGWKKANSADGGQTESWGTVKKDGAAGWGGSMAEPKDKTAGWSSAGGSAAPSEAEASGWKKATSKSGGETESWGAAKKDGAAGWGKSMDSQEGSGGKVTEEGSWGKTAEKSSTKAVWNSSTSAPESQTGGWGNVGESSWKKPDGGSSWQKQEGGSSWGNQAGGSSWTKQSDVNTGDESKGWGKPSGAERGFGGWNKDGMGNEDDTKSFDGGRGSGGRRGGRGGSQGGRNACFKCGETGHMARECSQGGGGGGRFGGGGGSGGGNACFKCGEMGHMARDCSQGGGGSNACFKCGETGHMARECSQGGGGGGGRFGSGGGGGCYKCGEQGHFARECPNA